MKYGQLVNEIFKAVGGKENVTSVSHCVTRLRFVLKDDKKALPPVETKKIKGVTECIVKSGQYQIVIGPHVEDVYNEVIAVGKFDSDIKKDSHERKSIFTEIINIFQQSVSPIIGPMAGTAMIKALLTILVLVNLLSKDSSTYQMLSLISDALFYFMPFYFAHSSSKYFGGNGYITMVIAGAMLHPTWTNIVSTGDPVSLFGLPVKLATYSATFLPIILVAWFESYVEKFARKISPAPVRIFLVPMITVLITSVAAFVVLGPLGYYVGEILYNIVTWLNSHVSWLVVALVAGAWPLLVMTGMHSSLMPIQAVERTTLGYATIITPAAIIANMSQAAAAFAVTFRTKDSDRKALATSTAISAVCGVTEPVLYGLNLPLKTPLIASIIGGSVGGLISGLLHVKAWSSGSSNIFSLPIFIGEDNSFIYAIIMIAVACLISFFISFILYKEPSFKEVENKEENKDSEAAENVIKKTLITSPMNGKLIELKDVNDDAFNSGALGKGVAIIPKDDIVYSPVDGVVQMVFKTKHSVGLLSTEGIEILIHIGLDTVNLEGKYFKVLVKQGDKVEKGTPLIRFDKKNIEEEGYDLTTPVIITNTNDFLDIIETSESNVDINTTILTVIK